MTGRCYMLARTDRLTRGMPVAPGVSPNFTADARRLPVSRVTAAGPVAMLLSGSWCLLILGRRPGAAPGTRPGNSRQWTVTGHTDLGPLIGPQYAALTALLASAETLLTRTGPAGEAYDRITAAMAAGQHTAAAWEAAQLTAIAALGRAGADTTWWDRARPHRYGAMTLALAARNLTGTGGWDNGTYELLTAPWRQATGHPAHPGDTTGPHRL